MSIRLESCDSGAHNVTSRLTERDVLCGSVGWRMVVQVCRRVGGDFIPPPPMSGLSSAPRQRAAAGGGCSGAEDGGARGAVKFGDCGVK